MTQAQQMTQYQQLLQQRHQHYHVAFTASGWFAAMSAWRPIPGYAATSASGWSDSMLQCQHRPPYVASAASETPKHFASFAASRGWVYCNCSIRTLFDAITASVRFAVIAASEPSRASCCICNIIVRRARFGGAGALLETKENPIVYNDTIG